MSVRRRWWVAGAVAALVAGGLTAWNLAHAESGALDDAEVPWRTSTDPVDTSGLTWLLGSTLHLADGTELELEAPTEDYVLAGDGVYYLVDDGVDRPALWFTSADGSSYETGLDLIPESLQASPDGRYLAGVDRSLEPTLSGGTPVATVLVLDLSTGEEVVRSTEGMEGSGLFDDLESLYSETEIGGLELREDEVYAETTDGDKAWSLETGEVRDLGEDVRVEGATRYEPRLTSADGRWRIDQVGGLADPVEEVDGDRSVTPRGDVDRWTFWGWADERTVIGSAADGPGSDRRLSRRDTLTMITCTVPSGACERYDETTGQTVWFPRNAAHGVGGLILQPAR